MQGIATVVKHTGSHYLLTVLPGWNLFPAVLRGKVRLEGKSATNPVAVGDSVEFYADGEPLEDGSVPSSEAAPAAIVRILPRRNYIIRKSVNLSRQAHIIAANIDRAFLVVTLAFPEVKLPFVDRLLVTCEVYGVKPVIVLNKIDIVREFPDEFREALENFHRIYASAGYPVIEVSAKTGEGIEELRRLCLQKGDASSDDAANKALPADAPDASAPQKAFPADAPDASAPQKSPAEASQPCISLFSGVSGVGKSSLIKALDPSLTPRTGEISEAHLQGRHTTTFYEMYQADFGGEKAYIIDTPGIRGFGLVDLEKEEIPLYFPEMLRESENCRFTPCTHTHEPHCAVKEAVERGEISPERYDSYLGMIEESTKYR